MNATSEPRRIPGTLDSTIAGHAPSRAVGASRHNEPFCTRPDTRDTATPLQKLVMVVVAIGIVGWAAVNLATGWAGFAAVVPVGFRGGGEAAISLARLFAALVFMLILADMVSERVRWVAAGFVVLGLGQLLFGYVAPMVEDTADLNDSLYQMILVRAVAAALFVVGLVPATAFRFSRRTTFATALFCAVCTIGYWWLDQRDAVPKLVHIDSMEAAARQGIAPMTWLTGWHWAMAALPLGLTVVAAIGAFTRYEEGEFRAWFPLSVILLAGSELHDSLWPSEYNSVVMNTADVLRLAMAAVVVMGGTLELRRIANERVRLLQTERERTRRLTELETLRADFTAMVAHELGHPLSAIRRLTEMLSRDGVQPDARRHSLSAILRETDALDDLVTDMQATAAIERIGFRAELRPVEVGVLIHEVGEIAASDSDDRIESALLRVDPGERVLADPGRIGQVLRNLLCNAARYSPAQAPITLRVSRAGDRRVRFEISDCGPGIDPADTERIFEKFGRSGDGDAHPGGMGLGLYLSRRIVQAHGSDLTVRSTLGEGATFGFELELAGSVPRGWAR